VTVQDTLPPTVTLIGAAAMPLECATPFTDPGATASDQCAGNNLPITKNPLTVDNRQLGPQTITYSANDGSGHSDQKTRTVTVSDTVAPTVTPIGPLNQQVECNDPTYADPGATVNEACDLTAPPVEIVNPAPVGTPGTHSVSYRATDLSGNVGNSASSRTVTVVDTQNPAVTLNGSATMSLECASTFNDPGATASDQCAGTLPVTTAGTVNNRDLSTQTLTYSANDGQGHSDTKTRAVTVRDTVAPTVTLNGPASQTVECNDPTYADPGATASDACDIPPPAAVPVNPPPVGAPGAYTVNYQATDRAGNVGTSATGRSVTVQDTLPPTLALNVPNPQALECGSPWVGPAATASDQCAGVLDAQITQSGGVNNMVPDSYVVTYRVSDGHGHEVSAPLTVNVSDTLKPDITVNGPVDDTFECGSTYVDPGATANDVCAGPLTVNSVRDGSQTTPGAFTISYWAQDPSGNRRDSSVTRTVTVNDNEPPTLVLVGSAAMTLECATAWTDPWATANDACFGDMTSRITVAGTVDNMDPDSYPLTYNVTDPSGLSATPVQRVVTVQDTQRPVVTVIGPPSIPVECGDGTYQDPGATASDSCAGTLPAVATTTADPNAPGTYNIGYQATDPSGNVGTSATTRSVVVSDTLNPVLTLNGQAAMNLECGTPWNDPWATANDQCAGNITGLIQRTGTVDHLVRATYPLRYTVMDPSGRSDAKDRAVTVRDTLVPEITVMGPLNDTFECGSTYVDPGATASDVCPGPVTVTSQRTGNAGQPGVFTISYTAEDSSGNSVTSSTIRTVTVNDNAPPTLVLLGSAAPSVECGTSWTDPWATADDACFGDLTPNITRGGTVNTNAPGSYSLAYDVSDPSGRPVNV
jgi:hypothetical protein